MRSRPVRNSTNSTKFNINSRKKSKSMPKRRERLLPLPINSDSITYRFLKRSKILKDTEKQIKCKVDAPLEQPERITLMISRNKVNSTISNRIIIDIIDTMKRRPIQNENMDSGGTLTMMTIRLFRSWTDHQRRGRVTSMVPTRTGLATLSKSPKTLIK